MKLKKVLFLAITLCCMLMMSSCDIINNLVDKITGKEVCDHSGGMATCTDKAICEQCGKEYGKRDPSVHSGEEVWFKRLNTHCRGYSCCGITVTEEESHSKSEGVCTVCGFDPVISISEAVISTDTETATITVSVFDNPGIVGLQLTLSFDESLTLTDVQSGSALAALEFTSPEDISRGGTFLWDGADIEDKDVKDGDILTLTFDISEATVGEYQVLLNVKAYDGNLSTLSFKLVNGVISVNG